MGLNIIRRIAGAIFDVSGFWSNLVIVTRKVYWNSYKQEAEEGLWHKGLSKLFSMSCSHESIDCCFILSLCLVRMTESCAIPKYLVEKYGAVVLIKTGRDKTKQQQNGPGHRKVSSTSQWSTTILYNLYIGIERVSLCHHLYTYYIMLYYIIWNYIVFYYFILYYIILYYTIYITLHYIIYYTIVHWHLDHLTVKRFPNLSTCFFFWTFRSNITASETTWTWMVWLYQLEPWNSFSSAKSWLGILFFLPEIWYI